MLVLAEEKEAVLIEKKSKFISIAKKCSSLAELKQIITDAKQKYPDATHIVHACIVGNEFSYSDDKEPKNTAGKPAFNVLKGSGINNICVLIVRYFGGTLLGTGGLVKAYSESVKLVLKDIRTEIQTETETVEIQIPYNSYNQVKYTISQMCGKILSEEFNEKIYIKTEIPGESKDEFMNQILRLM